MSTTSTHPARTTTPARGALPWAVLAAAVLQVVAPAVTFLGPGASPAEGTGAEVIVSPVGWAFAIWGPIYLLALVQAVFVLVTGTAVPRRLVLDQLALYLAGTAWVTIAAFETSIGTALALLLMAVAGIDGVLTVSRVTVGSTGLTRLSRASVGLYAGWVTAALFVNLATALASSGTFETGEAAWQLVVLAAAAVTLLVVTVASGGVLAYAAAGIWALVGIAVSTAAEDETAFVALAVVAAVALAATTVVTRRRAAR